MIQFSIKLKDDLYIRRTDGKITVRINPTAENGLVVEKDGLYLEDKWGFNDDGFVDQVSTGMRIGFNGPFSKKKDSGEYPNPGVISADSTVHRIFTMNSDLKTIDGYRRVDCILPGDIIRVPVVALQEEAEAEADAAYGAEANAAAVTQDVIDMGAQMSAGFNPRFKCPSFTNKFYILQADGGYNTNGSHRPQHPKLTALSNCVAYAFGRFNEIANNTSMSYNFNCMPYDAGTLAKNQGIEVGQTPKVGALGFNSHHVWIVEKVISSTTYISSNSAWTTDWPADYYKNMSADKLQELANLDNPSWSNGGAPCFYCSTVEVGGYETKGFCYHPNVSSTVIPDSGGQQQGTIHYVPINPVEYNVTQREDGCFCVEGLVIANKTYPLPKDYNPGENKEALEALAKMQKAAKADGINIDHVASSFRSYQTQKTIYENYAKREQQKNNVSITEGYLYADDYSARPGHSEHQTGLAFDVFTSSREYNGCKELVWLVQNCWKYGFINRYPAGKQDITGYMREDWHVRYVGTEWAKKIHDSGLCFEEFFGLPSEYSRTYDRTKY